MPSHKTAPLELLHITPWCLKPWKDNPKLSFSLSLDPSLSLAHSLSLFLSLSIPLSLYLWIYFNKTYVGFSVFWRLICVWWRLMCVCVCLCVFVFVCVCVCVCVWCVCVWIDLRIFPGVRDRCVCVCVCVYGLTLGHFQGACVCVCLCVCWSSVMDYESLCCDGLRITLLWWITNHSARMNQVNSGCAQWCQNNNHSDVPLRSHLAYPDSKSPNTGFGPASRSYTNAYQPMRLLPQYFRVFNTSVSKFPNCEFPKQRLIQLYSRTAPDPKIASFFFLRNQINATINDMVIRTTVPGPEGRLGVLHFLLQNWSCQWHF